MSHWMALLPGVLPPLDQAQSEDAAGAANVCLSAEHLAWWCLQFTPRVALLEGAVVLEVQASERLFGGVDALRHRIAHEAQTHHGVQAWAHAGTALAAVAMARYAQRQPSTPATHLDELPLNVLPGVAEHQATLARLGCQTLAQVRALPRGGLSRRFGADLLMALDQAYGLHAEVLAWQTLPPVFDAKLELPGRVETAPALLFAASRLLHQLCAWLAGRQAGVLAFTLRWQHDGQRRDTSREGAHTIRLGSPSRDLKRLSRLLAEHLQRIQLSAPVGEISLHAQDIEALPLGSLNLFMAHGEDHLSAQPDALITPAAQRAQRDALLALLDKLSVRLGPQRVLQGRVQADHRLAFMQCWQPAVQAWLAPKQQPGLAGMADAPQPSWVLPEPLHLALAHDDTGLREQPFYQGRLTLLAGPHRIEAGWWDTDHACALVARDYYLASSAHAGLLWIYKRRHALDAQDSPWYLHGFFA